MHGFCSTYLPGKPARYRSLLTFPGQQTLSHGHTSQSLAFHFGRSQRKMKLAYLCRLCSIPDSDRTSTLHQRQFWYRSQQYRLCARFNHHRPLSFRFPWSPFRRSKTAVKLHTLLDLRGNNPRLFTFHRAYCTMSTYSTLCCQNLVRSTSWIALTSISSAYIYLPWPQRSLLFGPSRT